MTVPVFDTKKNKSTANKLSAFGTIIMFNLFKGRDGKFHSNFTSSQTGGSAIEWVTYLFLEIKIENIRLNYTM